MSDFETIDRLAASLGAAPHNRQKWRSRGSVPHKWRLPILEEARRRRITIDPALFDDYRHLLRRPDQREERRPERVA